MPQRTPSVEVIVIFAELEFPLDQVVLATQEVRMQGMDVDEVDEATHMFDPGRRRHNIMKPNVD